MAMFEGLFARALSVDRFMSWSLVARIATRRFINERNARGLGGRDPFLAIKARKAVSVDGIPLPAPFPSQADEEFDKWEANILRPNVTAVVERLQDAGDVRQLAPLAMVFYQTAETDDAPVRLIPVRRYYAVERIMNVKFGVSLTLTVEEDQNSCALWVGYV